MTVHYDPFSPVHVVLRQYRGTVFPLVLRKPTFYFLVVVQVCFLVYDAHLYDECRKNGTRRRRAVKLDGCRLEPLDWGAVGLPASLLIFFVVFYGTNCYNRFYKMWSLCTDLVKLTLEWTARVHIMMPGKQNLEIKWRATRLVVAAIAVLFHNLGCDVLAEDPFDGKGMADSEYVALHGVRVVGAAPTSRRAAPRLPASRSSPAASSSASSRRRRSSSSSGTAASSA